MSVPPSLSPVRLVALAAVATVAAIALWLAPAAQILSPPDRLVEHWSDAGTAAATMAIVRLAGLAIAAWVGLLAVVGLVGALTRSAVGVLVWARLAPESLRRLVAASVITGIAASGPAVAAAADGADDGVAHPVPVLTDVGPIGTPTVETPPLLAGTDPVDCASAPAHAIASDSPVAAGAATTESWIVEPGDHLWRIAEQTLADRGFATTERAVARYWYELIDENRDVIGADIDLIHPGLVLTLPRGVMTGRVGS